MLRLGADLLYEVEPDMFSFNMARLWSMFSTCTADTACRACRVETCYSGCEHDKQHDATCLHKVEVVDYWLLSRVVFYGSELGCSELDHTAHNTSPHSTWLVTSRHDFFLCQNAWATYMGVYPWVDWAACTPSF